MQAICARSRYSVPHRTDVLVVGAGPTGLALACDLRSRGIAATVIDKADGPATTSRALGLQPRGAEILDRLGALGDLPHRAVGATALNLYVRDRRLARLESTPWPGSAFPGPLIIAQTEIEANLRGRLAELRGHVLWGTELLAAEQTDSGVEIKLGTASGQAILHADWMVGCDGAHSRTRKVAGITFQGTAFAERFLLADVHIEWNRPPGEIAVWLHRDGMFAAMPLPEKDHWRLMAEVPCAFAGEGDQGGTTLPDTDAVAILQRLLCERAGARQARIVDPRWVSLFRFHRRLASSYRCGRILLAGDAAHIHSPFGGQGMNTGLGDAYNLGWKLAMVEHGLASRSLLDTYEAERRPVAREVLARTTNTTNMLLGNSITARLIRDFLFLPMLRLPSVQRRLAAKGSQLGVSYRAGPLARSFRPSRWFRSALWASPRGGDRAPDAPCRIIPQGVPTTLSRETRSGWALLLFGMHSGATTACAAAVRQRFGKAVRVIGISPNGSSTETALRSSDLTVEDAGGTIARLFRAEDGEMVLLRPDGHVAWRTSSDNQRRSTRWNRGVFGHEEAPSIGDPHPLRSALG